MPIRRIPRGQILPLVFRYMVVVKLYPRENVYIIMYCHNNPLPYKLSALETMVYAGQEGPLSFYEMCVVKLPNLS